MRTMASRILRSGIFSGLFHFNQKGSSLLICVTVLAFSLAASTPALSVGENESCGGVARIIGSVSCDEGLWCDLAPQYCGDEGAPGQCVRLPAPGTCAAASRPVCGCTGTTYSSDCARILANDQKDHDGPCQ